MLQRLPRLPQKKRLAILKEFVRHHTATEACVEVGVNRSTANFYYNHFRQCIYDLHERAPRFSGEVEMDEKYFGRSSKQAKAQRRVQEYRGQEFAVDPYLPDWDPLTEHRVGPQRRHKSMARRVLVFGILRRGGGVYTQIIERKDEKTLRPIIHLVVEGGTKIFCDMHPAYNVLEKDGYELERLNHSAGFVNRKGTHIGSIESFWSKCQDHFRRFRGIRRRTYILHLKECEWRWNNREGDKKKEFDTQFKLLKKLAF